MRKAVDFIFIGLLVLSIKFYLLGFLIFFVLCSILISKKFNKDLLFSSFINFPLNLLFIGLLGLFANFFSTNLFLLVNLLTTVMSLSIYIKWKKVLFSKIRLCSKESLILFIIFTISLLYFLKIPLSDRTPEAIISLISSGEDNISHISLVNYIHHNNQLAYFQSEGIWRGLANYPQTIHFYTSNTIKAISQLFQIDTIDILRLYYLSLSILTSYVVSGIFYIFYFAFRQSGRKKIFILPFFIFGFLTVTVNVLIFMHISGYFAQLSSLVFLLPLFVASVSLFQNKRNDYFEASVIICAAGFLMTWYLAFLILLPLVGYIFYKNRKRIRLILGYILLLSAAAVPAFLHIIIGSSLDAVTINSNNPFSFSILSLTVLIAISYLGLRGLKNNSIKNIRNLYLSASLSYVITIILMFIFVGSVNYFFFKLASLVYVITLLSIGFIFTSKLNRALEVFAIILVSGILAIESISAIKNFDKYVLQYTREKAYLTQLSNEESQVISKAIQNNYGDSVAYINSCDKIKQYFGNRLIGAVLLNQGDTRRDFEVYSLKNFISINDFDKYFSDNPIIYDADCDNL